MSLARVCGAVLLAAGLSPAAAAQDDAPLPSRPVRLPLVVIDASMLPADRTAVLEEWTRAYAEWKEWRRKWGNRREPGWFSARARRELPVPPEWLPPACRIDAQDDEVLAAACDAWREWDRSDDVAAWLMQAPSAAGLAGEAEQKTQWWERIHLDAFWPMTQSGVSAFGVAGTHATIHVTKRLQIFAAPGAIVMRLPAVDGGQRWTPATDWGFSYSLFDFRMPGLDRPSAVHINLARVWVLGATGAQMPGELYLAGFSITFKRR